MGRQQSFLKCPQRDGYNIAIKANQHAQHLGGYYGVPLMVFNNEPFYDQNRFDQLEWRIAQQVLRRRDESAGPLG